MIYKKGLCDCTQSLLLELIIVINYMWVYNLENKNQSQLTDIRRIQKEKRSIYARGITMARRLKEYIKYMDKQLSKDLSKEEKRIYKDDLLIQIGFFQHERLIHLIVTITFAILSMMSIFCSFSYQTVGLYVLILLLLSLLIPYIKHYYVLENGVQKLYVYYDRLTKE